MITVFDPRAWYWAADDGRVYSGPMQQVVAQSNAGYIAFTAIRPATPWPKDEAGDQTDAALLEVISAYGMGMSGPLVSYANARQWALATGGYTATISGTPRTFNTDPTSMALMTGKSVRFMQSGAPSTTNWQFPDGFAAISAADFLTAATKAADFVQATFDALKAIEAAILAGTITTLAEVDAAAWPANHD